LRLSGKVRLLIALQAEYNRHSERFNEAFEKAAEDADAVLATHLTWDRAQAIADHRDIPMAIVCPIPIAPSREYSSPVLSRGKLRSPTLRRASLEATGWIWWRSAARSTNSFRRKLGLPAASQSAFRRHEHPGALGLHIVSPSLFPRPRDWGSHLKLTGAWEMPAALREDLGEELPEDLQQWLEDGEPPVYLGFGSMPVTDPETLLAHILAVTAKLGRRAIVSENCASHAARAALPDRIRVVGAVDHDRLFPQCAALVHHGGAGSTLASARSGRPTMICSVFGDQPWWGERLKRLGAGTHVPFRKLNQSRLEAGLDSLFDPAVIKRAEQLGAAIQAEGDGLPEAARLLEDWLLAKSAMRNRAKGSMGTIGTSS
jgi:sterol 3beta-glucosyltransferase